MLGRIKNLKLRYKIGAGVATAAAIVAGGGAAFGFFTASGAGNGSATVGSAVNDIAVVGATTTALTPSNSATMTFTAYNYSGFNQAISNIHVTAVQACKAAFVYAGTDTFAHASAAPTCSDTSPQTTTDSACAAGGVGSTVSSNWFSMPDVPVNPTGDGNLAANGHTTLSEQGTITMNDQNTNQNACEGLNLNFQFSTT